MAAEFWLGSHAYTSGQQQVIATPESRLSNAKLRVGEPTCNVLPEVVEARRQVRPPIQPSCEKGDIMLRDLRTWHAGMPNESENYRIMLALGYQVYHFSSLRRSLCWSLPAGTVVSKSHFEIQSSSQPRKLLHEALRTASRSQSRSASRRCWIWEIERHLRIPTLSCHRSYSLSSLKSVLRDDITTLNRNKGFITKAVSKEENLRSTSGLMHCSKRVEMLQPKDCTWNISWDARFRTLLEAYASSDSMHFHTSILSVSDKQRKYKRKARSVKGGL